MMPTSSVGISRCIRFSLFLWTIIVITIITQSDNLFSTISVARNDKQIRIQELGKGNLIRNIRTDISPAKSQKAHTLIPYQGNFYMSLAKSLHRLALANPGEMLKHLADNDPFQISGGPNAFKCPTKRENKIDYPDIVNHTKSQRFRNGIENTWILYQHLRKAGGTGFCDLATLNMARYAIPPYYCMPDNRGSLGTPPWNNITFLQYQMNRKHYRIAANEWDVFYQYMLSWEDAIYVTTFRHPIERYYSQYRFEHLEHRDGSHEGSKIIDMKTWYLNNRGWTMGSNYYVKTFIGHADDVMPKDKNDFYWSYHKYHRKTITWEMFENSVTTLRQFHLILQTEWLKDNATHALVEKILAWRIPPRKVLPHEMQAYRGAKTKTAIEALPADIYTFLLEDNALDVLMYHIAQRITLERMCDMGVIVL